VLLDLVEKLGRLYAEPASKSYNRRQTRLTTGALEERHLGSVEAACVPKRLLGKPATLALSSEVLREALVRFHPGSC